MSTHKVLVVARDKQEREAIDCALDAAGLDVLAVGDALGAYWALRGYAANVIVLDTLLPREDRDELRATLARDWRTKGISVIALGARPLALDELVGKILGAMMTGREPSEVGS